MDIKINDNVVVEITTDEEKKAADEKRSKRLEAYSNLTKGKGDNK